MLLPEEEPEVEDFEETPRLTHSRPAPVHRRVHSERGTQNTEPNITSSLTRIAPSRAGSMTTVRLQRRVGLAEKLREVFELDGIEEVRAGALSHSRSIVFYLIQFTEMPCWLLRSVCQCFL
jgi:sterol 3beta-glucosyltransferase